MDHYEIRAIDDQLNLIDEAEKALIQIKKSQYDTELRARGISNIYSMGIAVAARFRKYLGLQSAI